MVGRAVLRAIVPPVAPRCRNRRAESQRSTAPAAPDRLAPLQYGEEPAARQRPRPDAEISGGEVSRWSWLSPPRAECLQSSIANASREGRAPIVFDKNSYMIIFISLRLIRGRAR